MSVNHAFLRTLNQRRCRMKKIVGCLAVLGMIALLLGLEGWESKPAFAQTPSKVFKWKYVQHRIAAEPGMAYYKELFEKTLPAMSAGRLQIKMYWAGDLVKSTEALDAAKTGMVEIIGMPSIYFKGAIPESSIEYGLPFGIRTTSEMYNFMYGEKLPGLFGGWKAIDFLRKVYAKHGLYYLVGGLDCWPAAFMFTKPVNSVKDIKGKKVRASGNMITWIEKLGGQGVFIPGEEVYTALQTGALDGVTWGSAMGMFSMKFHEVCKYFLNPPLMPVNHMGIFVNQKAWDSLPDDLKAILEVGFIKAGLDMTNHQNFTGERWGLNEMTKKHKVTICNWTGSDLKAGETAAFQIWDEEAKKSPSCAELVQKTKDYMRALGYME
jgi:TRAP-type mannitol/chloroaromatic compound transport system substrate-binding protein